MEKNARDSIMTIPNDKNIEKLNLINAAFAASSINVVKEARFYNTPIISWQDGKIVEIDPFSIKLDEDKNSR